MPREFHRDLERLDQQFREITAMLTGALADVTHDPTSPSDLGSTDRVLGEVQERSWQLEERGHVLLARQAPVGGDLRRLVALLRLTTNVERAVQHTRHVLEVLADLEPTRLPPDLDRSLRAMGERAAALFQAGVDAWDQGDALAVIDLEERDQEIDALQLQLLEAASHSPRIHGATRLALGLAARHYERIADYGVSLARDTAFVVTGERLPT